MHFFLLVSQVLPALQSYNSGLSSSSSAPLSIQLKVSKVHYADTFSYMLVPLFALQTLKIILNL